MDLGKYLKIGLRWWWLMLLSVVLSATASYIYSQRQPKIYAARTSLMVGASIIEQQNPNERDLGLSRTLAEVYGELARRKPITQAVIDRLGLEMSADQLSGMIQTNVIPSAQLLEIFILDVHPQRAQLLANAVAEELIRQSPGGAGGGQERDRFIQVQLQELQTKIEDTATKIKELEDSLGSMTSAAEIAEAQSQLSELEKLKADYQNNYNQFLAGISESSVNRLAIFEPATEPTSPVAPNVKMNVLIAAVAGLALALSAIVLLEFFSDTLVWHPGETQSISDVPVLGAVGKMAGHAGKLVAFDKLWSPEINALRSIRDSISLTSEGQALTTLLVTSSGPGEGKSFLATNLAAIVASPGSSLAAVIASPGSKVILIDADLRKPSLHETFDMPNLLGLADVLAMPEVVAEAMLKKALKPTHIGNLLLLPAGRNPLDPGSLLNSPKFLKLLNFLKTQADLVVIDSSPLLEAIEAKVIANAVDGVVLVVSHGLSRRRVVQRALEYFRQRSDRHLLGLVFNRVNLPRSYGYADYAYTPGLDPQEKSKQQSAFLGKLWPFGRSQQAENAALTLVETADYLGVSKETAQRWCEQGRIPAVKMGRRWSVRLEDLNEFIAVYQHGGAPQKVGLLEPAGVDSARSNGVTERV